LGYFKLSKNPNEPPKVAQLVKNHPIWSPCLKSTTQRTVYASGFAVRFRMAVLIFQKINKIGDHRLLNVAIFFNLKHFFDIYNNARDGMTRTLDLRILRQVYYHCAGSLGPEYFWLLEQKFQLNWLRNFRLSHKQKRICKMSGSGFESLKMVEEVEEMSETDEFVVKEFISIFSTEYASTTLLFPDSNA
jgi:hypothetical protein